LKKFIFDIDGTLTPSRQQMDMSFMAWFIIFECNHPVYLVTGSDREKTIDQVGLDVYNRAERVYNCAGNAVYEKDKLIFQNPWTPSKEVTNFLLKELNYSGFPIRTGTHIEQRPGCINFSILGRGADFEQRGLYKKWDYYSNERVKIAERFNKKFPDLHAFVGGETGVDISTKGSDKSQILRDFDKDDIIHFFGDRMDENGNDYPLAQEVDERGGVNYHVDNWQDTNKRLLEIIGLP